MKIEFTKMQGAANDYIYIDGEKNKISDIEKFSIDVSRRHFSVGADGVVLILNSDVADFKMRMFNADGSEGKMCGNAIRCVAKYVYDKKMTDKKSISIETLSGIKYIDIHVENGVAVGATVNMGPAILKCRDIPCISDSDEFINMPINVNGKEYMATCVSTGNPHCITFVDDVDNLDIEKIGPLFENHPMYPERVNTEFVEIVDEKTVKMRVWERGSGETYACGTGACATCVACILNNKVVGNKVKVKLLGGELDITWDKKDIIMKGPAVKVYDGIIDWEE